MITQEDGGRCDIPSLSNLHHRFRCEHRASRTTERAVSRDMDALRLTEIHDLLLRQGWMVLDLVHGGDHCRVRKQLFQVSQTVVRNADGLYLACREQLLHLLPCLDMGPVADDIAGAIGELGELLVVSLDERGLS